MKSLTIFCLLPFLMIAPPAAAQHASVVASGESAGSYAAFPDVCKLADGSLYSIFYSGYGHVSLPNEKWPKGGRVMAVRSKDEGKSWSQPEVIIDTDRDDRDPSVVQLKNGDLLANWFTYQPDLEDKKDRIHVLTSRSKDAGKTWSSPAEITIPSPLWAACSAPIRQIADGSLILGLYHVTLDEKHAFGSTIKSYDNGDTWTDYAPIDPDGGVKLDAETDVITLKDGRFLAALRGDGEVHLHFSESNDRGKTWGKVRDSGFKGHCPYLMRHSSGLILLGVRLPQTSLYWSADEGATWSGPLIVDEEHHGAYPSMVELTDGSVLFVYYEEGEGSSIRAARLAVEEGKVLKR